ncbi:hypothetical protein AB2B38_008430 [Balneola sp. MJW-20]|uniref:hypothetical protein n=1 Tax=Gracilimonas aurantiaca TaxID=3234185 RepID=UPI00346701B7
MDLVKNYSELIVNLKSKFKNATIEASSRRIFLSEIGKFPGVYIISKETEVIYIGSSGKLDSDLNFGTSNVRSRISNSYTPYKLYGEDFLFNPVGKIKGTNKPEKYLDKYLLQELEFTCFDLTPDEHVIIPSALEHLLIQSYINELHRLPIVNQKI